MAPCQSCPVAMIARELFLEKKVVGSRLPGEPLGGVGP